MRRSIPEVAVAPLLPHRRAPSRTRPSSGILLLVWRLRNSNFRATIPKPSRHRARRAKRVPFLCELPAPVISVTVRGAVGLGVRGVGLRPRSAAADAWSTRELRQAALDLAATLVRLGVSSAGLGGRIERIHEAAADVLTDSCDARSARCLRLRTAYERSWTWE